MKTLINKQAETLIIIDSLLKKTTLNKLMDLEQDDFYFEYNKIIFCSISQLYNNNQDIDILSLQTQLENTNKYNEKMFNEFLISYSEAGYIPNVDFLIKDIKDKSKYRKTQIMCTNFMQSMISKEKEQDKNKLLDEFTNNILTIVNNKKEIDDCTTIKELSETSLDELYGKTKYIPYDIDFFDKILNGIYEKQFITIAARPGTGKTTLALNIMRNIKANTLFFSAEMDKKSIYAKFLALETGVDSNKIESYNLDKIEKEKVFKAHMQFKDKMNLIVYDNLSNICNMLNKARSHIIAGEKIDLIVIDYIQRLSGVSGNNENAKITEICRLIKDFTITTGIPVIALSQFSREVEKENRQPRLSDLRGSGSIEQDSDVIIFLHKKIEDEQIFSENGTLQKLSFIVNKNKKGNIGYSDIMFNKSISKFYSVNQITPDFDTIKNPEYFQN